MDSYLDRSILRASKDSLPRDRVGQTENIADIM